MKKLLALALLVFTFGTAGFAQTNADVDARLYEKFSKKEIKLMQAENPETLAFWSFYLDNGYSVMEMPKGKGDDLNAVDFDPATDNVLSLNVEPQENGNVYLRITSTGQLLALHSYTEVKSKMAQASK